MRPNGESARLGEKRASEGAPVGLPPKKRRASTITTTTTDTVSAQMDICSIPVSGQENLRVAALEAEIAALKKQNHGILKRLKALEERKTRLPVVLEQNLSDLQKEDTQNLRELSKKTDKFFKKIEKVKRGLSQLKKEVAKLQKSQQDACANDRNRSASFTSNLDTLKQGLDAIQAPVANFGTELSSLKEEIVTLKNNQSVKEASSSKAASELLLLERSVNYIFHSLGEVQTRITDLYAACNKNRDTLRHAAVKILTETGGLSTTFNGTPAYNAENPDPSPRI